MIFSLFSPSPTHPLADAREIKRVLSALPAEDAFKTSDEIVGWFESLQNADRLLPDLLFSIVRQLDEAGQLPVRGLAREYLLAPRLNRSDEQRYWSTCSGYWSRLADLYLLAMAPWIATGEQDKMTAKAAANLKGDLPLLAVRAIAAQGTSIKWARFHYGPIDSDVWEKLGRVYLAAAREKITEKPVQLYAQLAGTTSIAQEYLKAVVLEASSLDSLLPVDIELAEKLISHFLPNFVLSAEGRNDSLYWIDPAAGQPPRRLVTPPTPTPTVRLIALGSAPTEVARLIREVESGHLPPEVNLGGQYAAKRILAVLKHLALYWAPQPPVREHQRHPVKSRMSVIRGFNACLKGACGDAASALSQTADSWVVDNVSLGGFGTSMDNLRDDAGVTMKIGTLLCMQPHGGENWLIGVVRRLGKDSASAGSAGIQTIARQPVHLTMQLRGTGALAATEPVAGIGLLDAAAAKVVEMRVAVPPATFDLRESYDVEFAGERRLFSPVELLESGPDYEIARYRVLTAV